MHAALRGVFALYIGLIFGLVVMTMPATTHAADILLSPDTLSFPSGQEFSLKVTVDPGSDKVNAADGSLSFDPSILSVSNISKDGSVFSLWTADPTFSNSAGTISFSGGTPTAFSNKGT